MNVSRDIHNLLDAVMAVKIVAIANGEDPTAILVDRDGATAVEFLIMSGAYTDGDATPVLSHGDAADGSDLAPVADTDLLGTEAGAAITAGDQIKKLGYVGDKRYLSLALETAAASTLTVGVVALRAGLHFSPDVGD